MDEARLVRTSKFLSKYLRHAPQKLGLTLAPGGWVSVDALIAAAGQYGMPLTRAELDEVVARNNKRRFAYDESGTRIRANQGHSVPVDLQLQPSVPPATLYHGTGERFVPAILREGLRKMRRHHVHLSGDIPTALAVGQRHGRAAVCAVRAGTMHADGIPFFRSANGVWLVDTVPPRYIELIQQPERLQSQTERRDRGEDAEDAATGAE